MAQEKGRDGGSAASEAARLFADGTCALGLLLYGDVEKVDRGAAGDKIQKALSGLVRMVSDRSDTGDWGRFEAFREKMLASIPDEGARIELDKMLFDLMDVSDRSDTCGRCSGTHPTDSHHPRCDRQGGFLPEGVGEKWMVGDDDCPPVLKLFDEFREEMLRFIPQRFDEQKVILDTKLLKVREMVRDLVSDRSDTSSTDGKTQVVRDRCRHGIRFPHECKDCIYGDP